MNICKFCLKTPTHSFVCKNCKSLAVHYGPEKFKISEHEYFLGKRPQVDIKFIDIDKTIEKYGYSPHDILPFSTKFIVARCRFCLNSYDVMISTVARRNWKTCCKNCAQTSSAYSRLKSNKDEHEFYLNHVPRTIKQNSSSSFNRDFVKYELTKEKFGYDILSLKPKSNRKIVVQCEFCLENFDMRFSKLSTTPPFLCCKNCNGIGVSYSHQNLTSDKYEFYLKLRPNLDFYLINAEKTKELFGYDPKVLKPFSRNRIVAFCYLCKSEICPTIDYFSKENSKVTCKLCMRKKTVSTLQRKYGVSSVLDIESVKEKYKKSSIEKLVELVLVNRYKIKFISQFTIDTGVNQYSFDFFLPSLNLLIECQGDYFHDFKKNGYSGTPKDRAKTSWVENHTNYKLVHIWEHEIHLGRINKILDFHIHNVIESKFDIPDMKLINFRSVSEEITHSFLSQYHYLGNLGSHSKCYGAYFNDELIAVCTFGGTTRQTSLEKLKKLNYNLSLKTVRELRRFCIRPNVISKNLASFSLKKFIDLFKRNNPEINFIISFSDPTVGDVGTIYKASNWKELPKTPKSYHYLDDKTGRQIHKKTIWNIANRSHMKEREFVESSGLIQVPELSKHVWLKILNN